MYASRIARELGCKREFIERIYLAGLLHDIGKIGVPDAIIGKPDRLTLGRVRADEAPSRDRRAHPRAGRVPRRHRALRAPPPRVVRRLGARLSGAARVGRDPLPQPHHPGGGHGRGDDLRPPVPAARCRSSGWSTRSERFRGTQFDPDAADAFLRIAEREEEAFLETASKFDIENFVAEPGDAHVSGARGEAGDEVELELDAGPTPSTTPTRSSACAPTPSRASACPTPRASCTGSASPRAWSTRCASRAASRVRSAARPVTPGPGLQLLFSARGLTPDRRFTGALHGSVEATVHRKRYGNAHEPICHVTAGYCAGWYSALFGEFVLVRELDCAGAARRALRVHRAPRRAVARGRRRLGAGSAQVPRLRGHARERAEAARRGRRRDRGRHDGRLRPALARGARLGPGHGAALLGRGRLDRGARDDRGRPRRRRDPRGGARRDRRAHRRGRGHGPAAHARRARAPQPRDGPGRRLRRDRRALPRRPRSSEPARASPLRRRRDISEAIRLAFQLATFT